MYIASSSTTVKFHDFPDGSQVFNYQPGSKVNNKPIKSISWSKDGIWLSVVPSGSLAEIISIRNQLKLIHTVVNVEDPSCTAFQNTTKKFLAYGTSSGEVLIYDIKGKKIKTKFPKVSVPISNIEFTATDTHLIAGCDDGTILLYSSTTNSLAFSTKIPQSQSLCSMKTNPIKRNYVAAGSYEGVVVVWDIYKKSPKFFMQSHAGPVTGLAFSPINSELVLSTGGDRQFFCYDINTGKCVTSVQVNNAITSVDFLHDGTCFILGSQNGNISVYDARKVQEPISVFSAHNSAIKFALFQKKDDHLSFNNESEFKFSPQVIPEKQVEDSTAENSFIPLNDIKEGYDIVVENSSFQKDSFLNGLGLNNANDSTNLQSKLSVSQGEFTKLDQTNLGESKYQITNKILESNKHSTPTLSVFKIEPTKFLEADMGSPIKTNTADEPEKEKMFSMSELKKVTREVLKNELEQITKKISDDLKFQLTVNAHQFKRMLLNVHVGIIKEFIKVEDSFNNLREDLENNTPSDKYLLEENIRLKKQNALLEEQLALKMELEM